MLQLMCSGCRQPVDEASTVCGYCGLAPWGDALVVADVREVWCTTEQRYVPLAWVGPGQAFVCVCAKVHEVLECGGCGKAWGTAVNSYGETDRCGRRRCSACRVAPDAQVAADPDPACSACGHGVAEPVAPAGRWRRRRGRAGTSLECLECHRPVGRWEPGHRRSALPVVVVEAVPVLPVEETLRPEWSPTVTRWDEHEHDAGTEPRSEPVPVDQGAVGEPAAA
jgi:hypothetical protein